MTEKQRRLRDAVEHAAHLLPAQGPIEVFVHHNTLHAFEELSFHHAVTRGADLYGCQPYLSESRYLEELARGRILTDDLSAVLIDELGDDAFQLIGQLGTRFHLRLAMLQHRLRIGTDSELHWILAETETLRTFGSESPLATRQQMIDETRHRILRDFRNGRRGGDPPIQTIVDRLFVEFEKRRIDHWNAATWERFTLHLLWQVCQYSVGLAQRVRDASSPVRTRPQGRPAADVRRDVNPLANDVLIRFCAAFLDQGFSHWRLPNREAGFYRSFLELYRTGRAVDRRLRGLPAELERLEKEGIGPLESLEESLRLAGVSDAERDGFLLGQLLALPGWAGMIWQMETNAEWADRPAPEGTLVEYLAIRLILERVSQRGRRDSTSNGQAPVVPHPVSVAQRAFLVFQLAQIRGWSSFHLSQLSWDEWGLLLREVDHFSMQERRKVLHMAYERRFRHQALDALLLPPTTGTTHTPKAARAPFEIVCCIDDREESFRRHVEEIEPRCRTYGAAGFFAVAMYFRGVSDAHFRPLCPNIIKPSHYVQEEVIFSLAESHQRRAETRRVFGQASHRWHVGTRSLSGGIVTGLLGSLASAPLIARVLFPRTTARLRKRFGRLLRSTPLTDMRMQRDSGVPAPGPAVGPVAPSPPQERLGYTVEEMADVVERMLRDIGLTSGFSRLVVLLGHGSSSLNNPHESAYNCGACTGGHGGANARVFCRMANHATVRGLLTSRGLVIPNDTYFLGGEHNTCNDDVELFDLERLPYTHVSDMEHLHDTIKQARRRNAHERCRRFESAPLTLTSDEALQHVEVRAEDLSQARPEYNHATNALCVVGRRELTHALFLDRRAFLASYDPIQDDLEHSILNRILSAVVPVCAGINLEYYFSSVDVAGYGCGSKLPHNITSLLGVMEGAASDLRPGLSAQMTEIHEPVRILFVVEATPEVMLSILDCNESIGPLVRNEWVQLAVLDRKSSRQPGTIYLYRQGQFRPHHPESTDLPEVTSSVDWYRGWREHLGFASIRAATCAADTATVPVGGAEKKARR